ncbi:MAG: polysulfide reductase NrfD [Deltaproteobacteria bacterium]|nr:polysulfide reductase NrfD [Deltaproteobacteria bacterium]
MSEQHGKGAAMKRRNEVIAPDADGGLDEVLFRPVTTTGKWFYATVFGLLAVVALGVYAYLYQFRHGLGVTGLNKSIYWGIYITNFVFFVGISHAGTLISAILRISKAEWRRPITRSAEVITVMVLFFGVGSILIDLGRPDRMLNVLKFGRFQSPLLWDVTSISVYLTGSMIYLYLPLIPDIALIRDRIQGPRRLLYRLLSLGWTGTDRQWHVLEKLIALMAVLIIPIAVSVHTVVSFVFAMTVQPMWHSAIFGPYFVAGAIFSGIAALIVAMALLRKVYHLEDYLKPIHFNNLGILLLVMTLLWLYFTFAEFLTTWYGSEPTHMAVWWEKIGGRYAPHFWTMFLTCFVIPFTCLAPRRFRTITGTVIASLSVNLGMWLERFLIVVPTLANPRLPYARGAYDGTWVEWSILAGCFACFVLLYTLFTKFFPIVAIWEVREGRAFALHEVHERVKEALPGEGRLVEESVTP